MSYLFGAGQRLLVPAALTLCLLTAPVLLTGCDSVNERGVATISGRVVDSAGTPVGNANVAASAYGVTEITNGQGEFTLSVEVDSSRQQVTLNIFADGYEEMSRTVQASVDHETSVPEIVLQRTEFLVRYELTGTCFGIRSVAYNVTSGTGTNGGSGTFELPWSFEQTVTAPTSPTATAMSATCVGANGAAQSLTGRILVNGQERAMQTNAGTTQISVTVSTLLR